MRQIKKNPEPDHFIKWKSDFSVKRGRKATYEELTGTEAYLRLKESLLKEQGYICCYCEKHIGRHRYLTDCENFMPRHPDSRTLSVRECEICRDAQLTYSNLFVSCKGENAYSADHCNHKKDNWFSFHSCIFPTDSRINTIFGFRLDGRIFVIDPIGQEMARHLNLNSYVLEEQRKAALDTVLEFEFQDEDLLTDREYVEMLIEEYNSMQEGKYAEFCSMITYCLHEYYLP